MKRGTAFLLAAGMCLLLAACGGVPQSDYDAVVQERDALQAQLDALQKEGGTQSAGGPSSSSGGVASKEPPAAPGKVVLVDSGYTVSKPSDYVSISYAVILQNPNEDVAIQFPTITVTAKDENGGILSSEEQVLSYIAAGDTITYGNNSFYEGEKPSVVEITVSNANDNYISQNDDRFFPTEVFTFENVAERDGRIKKVTGEITNTAETDFSTVAISIIYKKEGKLVGGRTGYLYELSAGATKPFDLSGDSDLKDYDAVELHAISW